MQLMSVFSPVGFMISRGVTRPFQLFDAILGRLTHMVSISCRYPDLLRCGLDSIGSWVVKLEPFDRKK